MATLENSLSMLGNQAILQYILKGVVFTLIISVVAVFFGVLIGSVLAIVRNYCTTPKTRIFKWLASIYIEVFRNTPLLLWIFICLVFCPVPAFLSRKLFGLTSVETKLLFKAAVALILFSSSVIAEIIRGGLNSVAHGQFEAGKAQGFNMVQIMVYIILPQAFKNVVPTLLSQVITTIKDSSYLANVATIELMARVKQILSSANRMGYPISVISNEEENAKSFSFKKMFPLGNGISSFRDEIFAVQSNIIRDFAAQGPCIIVGRCADSVLKDYKNHLKVYIYAPYEDRLKNCTEKLQMDEKTAIKSIQEVDIARANYQRKYCPEYKNIFDGKDIMINSSEFGVEGTAKILVEIAKQRFSL